MLTFKKKTMKRFIKLTFFSTVMLFAFSCTDLEDTLEDSLTEEFSNDGISVGGDGGGGVLLAPFSRLRAGSATNGGYFPLQSLTSDEIMVGQKGGDWFDGGIWINLHRHTWDSSLNRIDNAWTDAYAESANVTPPLPEVWMPTRPLRSGH